MGIVVIACYRPKPGKEAELDALTLEHVPTLRNLGLTTNRHPIVARSQDGTVVEVFEWASQEAIDNAHEQPEVVKMWQRYGEACDYVKVADLPEAGNMWAAFVPIN